MDIGATLSGQSIVFCLLVKEQIKEKKQYLPPYVHFEHEDFLAFFTSFILLYSYLYYHLLDISNFYS